MGCGRAFPHPHLGARGGRPPGQLAQRSICSCLLGIRVFLVVVVQPPPHLGWPEWSVSVRERRTREGRGPPRERFLLCLPRASGASSATRVPGAGAQSSAPLAPCTTLSFLQVPHAVSSHALEVWSGRNVSLASLV